MPSLILHEVTDDVVGFGTATSCYERVLSSNADVKWTPGDADNYVEGLAKLGIARIPGYDPPPILHSGPRGSPGPPMKLA